MFLIKIDEFLSNLAINTTLTIEFKKLNVKNTNVTNSRRVSTYLGHHQLSVVILKFVIYSHINRELVECQVVVNLFVNLPLRFYLNMF